MCNKVFREVSGSKFSVVENCLFRDGQCLGERNPDYRVYLANSSGEFPVTYLQKIEWSKSPGVCYKVCRLHFIVIDGWSVEDSFLRHVEGDVVLHVCNKSEYNTFHNLFRIIGVGEIVNTISAGDAFERVMVELQVV